MAMIDEFMGPEYDRVTAFAKRHNIPIISVDTDGQVEQLVPTFMKHGAFKKDGILKMNRRQNAD